MDGPRVGVLLRAKDEGPFLLEWVAHYRLLGFDKLIIISNDLSDGSHLLLQALSQEGLIVHHDVSHLSLQAGKTIGSRSINFARRAKLTHDLDWVLVADADEFLAFRESDNIKDYLREHRRAAQILLLWRNFVPQADAIFLTQPFTPLVTERFRKAHLRLTLKSLSNLHVSPNLQPHRLIVHERRPTLLADGTKVRRRALQNLLRSKGKLPNRLRATEIATEDVLAEASTVGCLNHYMVKSAEEYVLTRWERGAAGRNALKNNALAYVRYCENVDCAALLTAEQTSDNPTLEPAKRLRDEIDQLVSLPSVRAAQEEVNCRFITSLVRVRNESPVYRFIYEYFSSSQPIEAVALAETIARDHSRDFAALFQLAAAYAEQQRHDDVDRILDRIRNEIDRPDLADEALRFLKRHRISSLEEEYPD